MKRKIIAITLLASILSTTVPTYADVTLYNDTELVASSKTVGTEFSDNYGFKYRIVQYSIPQDLQTFIGAKLVDYDPSSTGTATQSADSSVVLDSNQKIVSIDISQVEYSG